jgi:hypothetical protein
MTNTNRKTAAAASSRLDHASLRGEPGASHTHYSISLLGQTDERWTEAFRAVCAASPERRAFQLNPRSRTVSFSCLTLEGPALVFEMLERLESLLKLADRRVEAAARLQDRGRARKPAAPPFA